MDHDIFRCVDEVWPNLPKCAASHPGPGAVIVPCPYDTALSQKETKG